MSRFNTKNYGDESVPLGSYMALVAAYGAVSVSLFALEKVLAKDQETHETPLTLPQFFLLAIGSYKFSRVVTMSFIGSPIRAPFTTRGESLAGGEVQDHARGEGIQKAIGSLLTCPFCFNVWGASTLFYASRFLPQLTMRVATILSLAAVGDVFHLLYRDLRQTAED